MNIKTLALSTIFTFSTALIAHPAAADVSIEIISRSNQTKLEVSVGEDSRSSSQSPSTQVGLNEQTNDSHEVIESSQPQESESSDDEFEGILIRI